MINTTILAVFTLCSIGLIALRLSWRQPGKFAYLLNAMGWALLTAFIFVCINLWGTEFGISYALTGISLAALIAVSLNIERRPALPARMHEVTTQGSLASERLLTFFTAGPLAVALCCQTTLLLVRALPGSTIDSMAVAALAFPVSWGVLAYVTCLVARPRQYAMIFFVVTLISSSALYL